MNIQIYFWLQNLTNICMNEYIHQEILKHIKKNSYDKILKIQQRNVHIYSWLTSIKNIFKDSALGRFFHRVAMSVCQRICLSPSLAIFFEASHWPSGHMIRSRPLIGRPQKIVSKMLEEICFKDFGEKLFQRFWKKFVSKI